MTASLNRQDNPELFEAAVMGRRLEEFWDSDIGQYLLTRALGEYNSALEQFQSCDPTDTKTVIRLQSAMARSSGFKEWLSVGISEGLKAVRIIEGQDE